MTNKKNQHLCLVCLTSKQKHLHITLDCGCSACASCLTSWILTKIKEFSYHVGDLIPCFTSGCSEFIQIEDIKSHLPRNLLSQVDNALLKIYLSKAEDIRQCPKQNCSYAGVTDISSSCGRNLICSVCETEWRDPQQFSRIEMILDCLKRKRNDKNDMFSGCWKWFSTKKCPGCSAPIQKNGGCESITCSQCNLGFCWTCLAPSDHHSNNNHYSQERRTFVSCWIAIAISFLSLYQVPFVKTMVMYPVSWIPENIMQGIIWVLVILGKILIAVIFDYAFRTMIFPKPAKSAKYVKQKIKTGFFLMIGCVGIIHYCDIYQSMAITGCIEAIGMWLIRKAKSKKNNESKYIKRS